MRGAPEFLPKENVDVVIYHSPCNDGHACAALFYHYNPKIMLVGLHPKDIFFSSSDREDLIKDKNVVFTDIAFDKETMTRAASLAKKILILDHHITNKTTLGSIDLENVLPVFVMDLAGVCITWDYLYPTSRIPAPLYYIGLKDVWKHENDEDALYFTTAFDRPDTLEDWAPYISTTHENHYNFTASTIQTGKIIYDYNQSVLKTLMQKVQCTTWRGYQIAMVNVPYPFISDIGAQMCENDPKNTIAVVWNKPPTGPYSVSLRSNNPDGPDIEAIALEFKGGGHKHGAGLKLDKPPFEVFIDDGHVFE